MTESSATDLPTTGSATVDVNASAQDVYALLTDLERLPTLSPENQRCEFLADATGIDVGVRFRGHNKSGDNDWTRACQVAAAEPGRDFTFVVGGVEDNCTWWSYEMEPVEGGTRLTERWWLVNKTPGVQGMSQEQFEGRAAFTETMLKDTISAIKAAAES